MTDQKRPTAILANVDTMLPELEAIYKDIHAHPELSKKLAS
jgi:metal-dependent amidase/aminoacylase/carboxypeptidase family protein